MRSKVIVPAMGAVALSLVGCGSSGTGKTNRSGVQGSSASASASPPTRIYRIPLNGKAEVPPGAPTGRGAAIIAFRGDSTVCWRFAHLHGFTSATFAHIHQGSKGQSSNIVVPLSTAPRLHHQGCVTLSPVLTKAIWHAPSRYYVNIHSTQYPGGAVRGQL
jgi:hypothetical protein